MSLLKNKQEQFDTIFNEYVLGVLDAEARFYRARLKVMGESIPLLSAVGSERLVYGPPKPRTQVQMDHSGVLSFPPDNWLIELIDEDPGKLKTMTSNGWWKKWFGGAELELEDNLVVAVTPGENMSALKIRTSMESRLNYEERLMIVAGLMLEPEQAGIMAKNGVVIVDNVDNGVAFVAPVPKIQYVYMPNSDGILESVDVIEYCDGNAWKEKNPIILMKQSYPA